MSRFYPHPAYAEDQPLSHLILSTHVLTRGFQAGTIVGSLLSVPIYFFRRPKSTSLRLIQRPFPQILVRSAGVGTVIGTGLLSMALAGRMWGKEPIEWNDRAWRLLENKGQVEVDDWGYGGALFGAAGAAFSGGMKRLGWQGFLGSMGLWSLAGVGGYMVWRHGVNGRKLEEDKSLSR